MDEELIVIVMGIRIVITTRVDLAIINTTFSAKEAICYDASASTLRTPKRRNSPLHIVCVGDSTEKRAPYNV